MTLKAEGLLRHRFWGDYSAVLILKFDSPESCLIALPRLAPKGAEFGWDQSETNKCCALAVVDSDQLSKLEAHLETLGAEKKKIASLAKSVDHGEPFSISFEVEHPDQMKLNI